MVPTLAVYPKTTGCAARREFSASINACVIGQASLGPRIIAVKRVRRPDEAKEAAMDVRRQRHDIRPWSSGEDFFIRSSQQQFSCHPLSLHVAPPRFEKLERIVKDDSNDDTGP